MASLWIMRLPGYLWQSFSDMNPRELLARHLQLREQLIQDFDLNLQTNLTLENYIQRTGDILVMQNQEIRKKDILKIIVEYNYFNKNSRTEWWGNYNQSSEI